MRSQYLATLYLRIVVAGALLLHNIGLMQSYNEEIARYPSWDGISGGVLFGVFITIECIAASMLAIGWRVRLASALLVLQGIASLMIHFPTTTGDELELKSIFIFIYIYIFIVGGGFYSFDEEEK